jgi:hypothetical protein
MDSVESKICKIIKKNGRGQAYTNKDFLDYGSRAAIDQALSRLVAKGALRRLRPGLYDFPRINKKLGGELSPLIEEAAKAIARKNNIRILSSGSLAANNLGLSTQVPAKIVFLTDGRNRKIKIGNQILIFKHASPKTMLIHGTKSESILQALRYIGKKYVDKEVIRKLKNQLSKQDKKWLLQDARHASGWIRDVAKEIIGSK